MSKVVEIENYFKELKQKTLYLYELANIARKKGFDLEDKVEIPLAKDISERVEGLISVLVPEIIGKGIPQRIRELEKEYGPLDWRVALTIAKEVAEEKFLKFDSKIKALEVGVRVGLAYITMGTVSAPIEGFVGLKEKKTRDGKTYIAAYFAGPIRGAGGTAAAVSVLLADYLRCVFGYSKYDPSEEEIKRYQIEIQDYHERVTRLQYFPTPQEIEFLVKNIGIEITGAATESKKVSNFKGLPRVETDFIRGGMCLVLAEGVAQKAKKIWKKLSKWGESFGFTEWNFLADFLKMQEEIKASLSGSNEKEDKKEKIEEKTEEIKIKKIENKRKEKLKPNYTYIKDLAAGRPVFGYPLVPGGFRLRFGRANFTGFASQGIHPSTMEVTYKFLAIGTQMRGERPGKGTIVLPIDSIEAPIVKLKDGEIKRVENPKEAEELVKSKKIEKILFLGDLLVAYGDFLANGHKLVPVGYNEEWWLQDVLESLDENLYNELKSYLEKNKQKHWKYGRLIQVLSYLEKEHNFRPLNNLSGKNKEFLFEFLTKKRFFDLLAFYQINLNDLKFFERISELEAIIIALLTETPLHPYYTFFYDVLVKEDFKILLESLKSAKVLVDGKLVNFLEFTNKLKEIKEKDDLKTLINELKKVEKLLFSYTTQLNKVFDKLCVPLKIEDEKFSLKYPKVFITTFFDLEELEKIIEEFDQEINQEWNIKLLNKVSLIKIAEKGGTFIGTRMGRPEKAKMREMKGTPEMLFVVGDEGGRMRNFIEAHSKFGFINGEVALFKCKRCGKIGLYRKCVYCDSEAERVFYCKNCKDYVKAKEENNKYFCEKCGEEVRPCVKTKFETEPYLKTALRYLNLSDYPQLLKGVRGMSSRDKMVERLEKGLLCSKYALKKNKDGTIRYDATQAGVTHFRPKDLLYTTIEDLKKLGYTKDIFGNELTDENQILEIKPQDVILPACDVCAYEGADKILFRVSKYLDEMLEKLYGLDSYYNLKTPKDLIGHLVIGLAPHTSAGIIGRIIGFSRSQTILAHPMWHAAQRRNLDGDETCVILALDAFLNFSRKYLPDHNGGTMDAPLVVTIQLIPSEVDDEVHNMDIVPIYPKELYLKAKEFGDLDLNIEIIEKRLGKTNQYFNMFATHYTTYFNEANAISAYKTINDMEEKVWTQMDLEEKLICVDEGDAASLVIEKHFFPDIKGNFRKFFSQELRCVKCNTKYRRIPLSGRCEKCGGNLVFTISEGSVKKYLDIAVKLSQKYRIKPYVLENLNIIKRNIETVFGQKRENALLSKWLKA